MDVRSMLNPSSDGGATVLKTPQRTVSLAQPHFQQSPPPVYPPLPRTASLPAQGLQYRESSLSVSPKTMPSMPPPPPAPVGYNTTPSHALTPSHAISPSHAHTPAHAQVPSPSPTHNLSQSQIHSQPQMPSHGYNTPSHATPQIHTPAQIMPPQNASSQRASHSRGSSSQSHSIQATPSPNVSRKRSLSISDHQNTPQPAPKRRKYAEPPIWAWRERDGHVHHAQARQKSQQPAADPTPQSAYPPQTALAPQSNMEPSLDNHEPYNDLTRTVSNWLWDLVIGAPDYGSDTVIEVEAKLGELLEPSSQRKRVVLPIVSEAVMRDWTGPGKPNFNSGMELSVHQRLNNYLNIAVQQGQKPGRQVVKYEHLREKDTFYDLPPQFLATLNEKVQELAAQKRGPRVRVTTDLKTNQVKATIVKFRVADLEVYCPNDDFDYRISISLETKYNYPVDGLPEHMDGNVSSARIKDRLSYKHQGYQVDLTQVKKVTGGEPGHELEVELDINALKEEGRRVQAGLPNNYEDLVKVFLNNVRVINRAAKGV